MRILIALLILAALSRGSILDVDSFMVVGMAEELVDIGNGLYEKGSYVEATKEWKKAVLIHPWNLQAKDALYSYSLQLTQHGMHQEAIDILSFVVNTAKVYQLEIVYSLAVSFQKIGDIEESANWYRKVLEHDPAHGSSRINLASLHHSHGSIEEALKQYRLGLMHLGPYLFQRRFQYVYIVSVMGLHLYTFSFIFNIEWFMLKVISSYVFHPWLS